MKKKTLTERMLEETLSDNSNVENCKQCKDCIFKDDGTVWSNHYTKTSCQIYKHPNFKPLAIMDNKQLCVFYNKGEDDE